MGQGRGGRARASGTPWSFLSFSLLQDLHRFRRSLVLRLSPALATPSAGLRNSLQVLELQGLSAQTVLAPRSSSAPLPPSQGGSAPRGSRKARLRKRFRSLTLNPFPSVIGKLHVIAQKNSGNSS